jgi:signal transduction histidine kinase
LQEKRGATWEPDQPGRLAAAIAASAAAHEPVPVLDWVVAMAREVTGAAYGAIAIVDEGGDGLADFIATGTNPEEPAPAPATERTRRWRGRLTPRRDAHVAHDVLTQGLWLASDASDAVCSYLDTTIVIGGRTRGSLYVAGKEDSGFGAADADALTMLAGWAAVAVEQSEREQSARELSAAVSASAPADARAAVEAAIASVASSRARVVEEGYAERQRIERDLHDGVQQDLVGMRIKIDQIGEMIWSEPDRAEGMIKQIGLRMDEVLESLRDLAKGIYPTVLEHRGLGEALKSAALHSPLEVSVNVRGLGRYREELEIGVYFCCLEALQNAVKHAGREATVTIRATERFGWLSFEVCDTGEGFDVTTVDHPHGLRNMHDRIASLAGTLTVSSRERAGTVVRGRVPIE